MLGWEVGAYFGGQWEATESLHQESDLMMWYSGTVNQAVRKNSDRKQGGHLGGLSRSLVTER